MKDKRISTRYLTVFIVAAIFCAAFFLRAYFPAEQILGSQWIKFSGNDAYYHMRLVDNLVSNFPQLTAFDPYHIFPDGMQTEGFYLFDWMLAAVIWIIGLGSPSPVLVDIISVYFPAVLGALAVIPVYFLGKELFNRWAGFIAAILVSVLPSEFLNRSILGFTDHHVIEVLFTTTVMLFLVLAIKSGNRGNLSSERFWKWSKISRPVIFSLLAGLFMGLYFIIWQGAQLFVFIIFLYLVIQIIIDHLQSKKTDYLGLVSTVFFSVVMLVYLELSQRDFSFHFAPLLIALIVPPVLVALSRVMMKYGLKRLYFPVAVFCLGAAVVAVLYADSPIFLKTMLQKFSIFLPTTGTGLTTSEMMPFFEPIMGGNLFWTPAWLNLYTSLPLSIFAFFIIVGLVLYKRRFAPEMVLFLLWSLVIFLVTVMQRRFDYYFTVNAALLVGYITVPLYLVILFIIDYLRHLDTTYRWRQIQDFSCLEINAGDGEAGLLKNVKGENKRGARPWGNYLGHSLAAVLIFLLVVFPGLGMSVNIAKAATFAPSSGWCAALIWLKENSPEPFGDPDAYYRSFPAPLSGESFDYPETAYGVMSWWDYGYLITRIAHRIPYTNPSQASGPIITTSGVFLSQDEAEARAIVESSKNDYIIADYAMTTSKFWAIAEWADRDQSEFYGLYYLQGGNEPLKLTFYYPEYYRSLLVRLYNFDGKAVIPDNILVIGYDEEMTVNGRRITDIKSFADYQKAVDFINSQEQGNFRIMSPNPLISAVPLEAVNDYRLAFSSEEVARHGSVVFRVDEAAGKVEIIPSSVLVPEVKIFEFKPD
ncbi:MAG: oligosaccharyl transferase, archaeosortase A system-associated [Dehalococcoidales bacterium]|jgi:dolichyl-diphosphooligosaccharide--protein glycosyltransferase